MVMSSLGKPNIDNPPPAFIYLKADWIAYLLPENSQTTSAPRWFVYSLTFSSTFSSTGLIT